MTYIITYNNGSIKTFKFVNYCDICNTVIILYCNNNQRQYEIKREDIAYVVFYP